MGTAGEKFQVQEQISRRKARAVTRGRRTKWSRRKACECARLRTCCESLHRISIITSCVHLNRPEGLTGSMFSFSDPKGRGGSQHPEPSVAIPIMPCLLFVPTRSAGRFAMALTASLLFTREYNDVLFVHKTKHEKFKHARCSRSNLLSLLEAQLSSSALCR